MFTLGAVFVLCICLFLISHESIGSLWDQYLYYLYIHCKIQGLGYDLVFVFVFLTSSYIYAHVFIALNTLAFHGYVFDMCLLSCIDIYISMLLCICLLHLVSRPIPKGVGRSCKHILDLWGCVSRLGRPFMSTEL